MAGILDALASNSTQWCGTPTVKSFLKNSNPTEHTGITRASSTAGSNSKLERGSVIIFVEKFSSLCNYGTIEC